MLKPRPIYELLDYHFIIPPYQRGYRWDKEQVDDLLDDLKKFVTDIAYKEVNGLKDKAYYCLQPIAVVPLDRNNPDNDTFYVIDGQQRLTTLYLLLQFLRPDSDYKNSSIFSLKMDARDIQQEFIDSEAYKKEESNFAANIDCFYIQTAYNTIVSWFEREEIAYKSLFRKVLFERPIFALKAEEMNNVRFIWYEMEDKTALEAFRRLNFGKIPLTSTELIKALLMSSSTTPNDGGTFKHSSIYRHAAEWDAMEHSLHNPYLWSMLSDGAEDTLSHLDLVLDFVADELNAEITNENGGEPVYVRKEKTLLNSDKDLRDYFNYNVINHIINKSGRTEDAVESIWSRIRDAFNRITNWYDDRDWYHLIGLLKILPKSKNRKKTRDFVRDVYKMSVKVNGEPVDRPEFTRRLKSRIKDELQLKGDAQLDTISYSIDDDAIRAILKALNVRASMLDKTDNSRFAFHLFDEFNVTSLEHIHPQNITTNDTHENFKKWFECRRKQVQKLSQTDFEAVAIKHVSNYEQEALTPETKAAMADSLRKEVAEAEHMIHSLAMNEKKYRDPAIKNQIEAHVRVFDKLFGDLTGISERDLHGISNMALVDKDTNSALQNNLLDTKRQILMTRQENGLTYVPPATRMVFNKEYSRKSPGDMRLWRPEDRRNYFKAIKEAYDFFTTD